MRAKALVRWSEIRDSLWFLPATITGAAAALALLTVYLDRSVMSGLQDDPFFGGSADGARGVLSAIAGSIITVTGVVFSVTVVALQLAASQFSPRVLRSFTSDRVSQFALGIFIGTFTYTLLVLRSVRSADENNVAFVPALSVSVSIVLVLVSIAALILFIDHVARSIQVSDIVDRISAGALREIDRLFPAPLGEPAPSSRARASLPRTKPATVDAREAGYLKEVDEEALSDLADRARLTVKMERRIGDFVVPGAALASLWPADRLDGRTAGLVRRAFVQGPSRSPAQDLEFSLTQLADIAVKALSPGVNDPTTAQSCIDRLSQILVVLGNRAMPETTRTGEEGRLLFLAHGTSYERCVRLSFDQIRHYGAGAPYVAAHLLAALAETARLVPAERRAPLMDEARSVLASARRSLDDRADRAVVERAARGFDPTTELPAARPTRRAA